MAQVVVKLKKQNKRFTYSCLDDTIVLSDLKQVADIITGKVKHYPEETITDFTFGIRDYHGIDTIDDWTNDDIDAPVMKGFSYIREVMENLLENKLVNK
jgi:hypothetical protein